MTKYNYDLKLDNTEHIYLQAEEMLRGKPGYGGSIPCAQTAGERRFYEEYQNPVDLLLNGEYRHVPVFFGANSHEGSYIMLRNSRNNWSLFQIIRTYSHSCV